MIIMQLSSGQGPAECCLAVAKTLCILLKEADKSHVKYQLIEQELGNKTNTFRSVLLSLEGDKARHFAQRWQGSIQWVCQSPYRPSHPRKNWFIGCNFSELKEQSSDSLALDFEACRSSGPGGQHANKTNSAIRATHRLTGLSVKVQSERSQHANKRLAIQLIQYKLENKANEQHQILKNTRHKGHHKVERGKAIRIFLGRQFNEIKR